MLAEAFLFRIAYEEIRDEEIKQTQANYNDKRERPMRPFDSPNENECADLLESRNLSRSRGNVGKEDEYFGGSSEDLHKQHSLGMSSESMYVPKRTVSGDSQLDLYTSWSSFYASIYKNYPDMHIGGQHILNKMDSGCILDYENEAQDGPVLLSVDIATNTPPADLVSGSELLQACNIVETRERSITLPQVPISNSVLNGYIEKEIQELYKQFIEENQVVSDFPVVFSSMLMNNFNQAGALMSQEPYLARQAILNCLRSAASGASSDFDTPVLHISNMDSNLTFKYSYNTWMTCV
uniref:Uncharacterized protein n=1 Tax=Leptobrachium leishanense TaxID=445787 RepID=A0A8C5PF23_9ANUR